jgi:EpsI family protein
MGLLALVFIGLYAPVFGVLARTWWVRDDYSHGFLIPLISLYLIWYRRERLRDLKIQPARHAGVWVLLLTGAMLLVGEAADVATLQELSIVVAICGVVLCLFGQECLKALGFPIAYLLFMIPITDEVIGPYHWQFQLLTAKMGVAFLQTLGVPTLVESQYIVLPNIILEVARVCSGINYLISIIAIGIPLAYVTQKNAWCRVVLVVSAVIIGIIANWVRVAAIGLWAFYGGEVLHGPFHVFQGLFVAQLGFVALFMGAWILSKVPGPPPKVIQRTVGDVPAEGKDPGHPHDLLDRSWLAAFVILGGLFVYIHLNERGPVPLKADLGGLPFYIGSWMGREADPQEALFRVQGADHELVRIYRSPSGHEIQLYVAYLESQRQSKELVDYRTAQLHRRARVLELVSDGQGSVSVNQGRIGEDPGVWRIHFWYDLNGRIQANPYKAKLSTALDALIHRRTNGALVLMAGRITQGLRDEDHVKEERDLIRELLPILRRYLTG